MLIVRLLATATESAPCPGQHTIERTQHQLLKAWLVQRHVSQKLNCVQGGASALQRACAIRQSAQLVAAGHVGKGRESMSIASVQLLQRSVRSKRVVATKNCPAIVVKPQLRCAPPHPFRCATPFRSFLYKRS